ncbi:RhuM family protein [Neisseria leonii]|uniref:RhuM family protein n=1 Tax=Neisseria leonii TaxID=2995413 RepID=UPI00237ADA19|nr:RhuM family protein [Neisseria sp. 3986]MDD9324969.1 virulence RhuM family protein [Neisseria sp. 3986]
MSGKTAAELIYERANADLPQMGLTHTATPQRVYQKDVKVAKSYLNEQEIKELNLIVRAC